MIDKVPSFIILLFGSVSVCVHGQNFLFCGWPPRPKTCPDGSVVYPNAYKGCQYPPCPTAIQAAIARYDDADPDYNEDRFVSDVEALLAENQKYLEENGIRNKFDIGIKKESIKTLVHEFNVGHRFPSRQPVPMYAESDVEVSSAMMRFIQSACFRDMVILFFSYFWEYIGVNSKASKKIGNDLWKMIKPRTKRQIAEAIELFDGSVDGIVKCFRDVIASLMGDIALPGSLSNDYFNWRTWISVTINITAAVCSGGVYFLAKVYQAIQTILEFIDLINKCVQYFLSCHPAQKLCPDGSYVKADQKNDCKFPECEPYYPEPDYPEPYFPVCPPGMACPDNPDIPLMTDAPLMTKACSPVVKECLDGSYVEQDPNNDCQFNPCPTSCPPYAKICPDGSLAYPDPDNSCQYRICKT